MSTSLSTRGSLRSLFVDLDEIDQYRHRIVTMPVLSPASQRPLMGDDGRPVCIGVRCRDSEPCLLEKYDAQVEYQLEMQRTNRSHLRSDFLEEQEVRFAVAASAFWTNIVLDGALVELSAAAASNLYRRFPWIMEQVKATCYDLERFADPSLPTEAPSHRKNGD